MSNLPSSLPSFASLARLAQTHDLNAFRQALQTIKQYGGEELNQLDADKRTILHLACSKGLSSIVNTILEETSFTQVNAVDKLGRTALHFAAMNGHVETIVEILDKSGHEAGFSLLLHQDAQGRTALQCASRHRAGKRSGESVRAILSSHRLGAQDRRNLVRTLDGGSGCSVLYGASAEAAQVIWEYVTDDEDRLFLLGQSNEEDRPACTPETLLRSAVADPSAIPVLLRMAEEVGGEEERRRMVFSVTDSSNSKKQTCLHRTSEDVLGILLSTLTREEIFQLLRMQDASGHTPLHHLASHLRRKPLEMMVSWIQENRRKRGQQQQQAGGMKTEDKSSVAVDNVVTDKVATNKVKLTLPLQRSDSLRSWQPLDSFSSAGLTPLHSLLLIGCKWIHRASPEVYKAAQCLLAAPSGTPPGSSSPSSTEAWEGADPNLGCRARVEFSTGLI